MDRQQPITVRRHATRTSLALRRSKQQKSNYKTSKTLGSIHSNSQSSNWHKLDAATVLRDNSHRLLLDDQVLALDELVYLGEGAVEEGGDEHDSPLPGDGTVFEERFGDPEEEKR